MKSWKKGIKDLRKWEQMDEASQSKYKDVAKMEEQEIFRQYLEFKYIGKIEDSMDCAGICRSPLFYFSKSVYSGFPKETCMKSLIDYVQEASQPVGVLCRIIGTTLVFTFVMGITLFGKTPLS